MLKFAVFDQSEPARTFAIEHGHLIGSEQLVIPGEITFEKGYLCVEKRTDGGAGSAGLGLLIAIEPFEGLGGGELVLRTCLLPQRNEPYLLTLELARQKVMTLYTKLEEWAFFDRFAEDPALRLIERARAAFTAALLLARRTTGEPPYTAGADAASRHALSVAVAAGEALSLAQASLQHGRRCTGEMAELAKVSVPSSALTDDEAHEARGARVGSPGVILPDLPKVGCRVNPHTFTPGLCDALIANFDFISLPMRWVDMEPTEGKYGFAKFDRWIEWAVTKAKLPVHAGAVIDLHPRAVPDWLSIWEHDYETLRDVVTEHVKNVVTRYRRTVAVWTVASSLNVGGTFKFTYEQSIDLTRACVLMVKKLQPNAKVHVEIAQPFGEHGAQPRGGKSIPPVLYCELMNQTQTPVDAFAVRVQAGQAECGRGARALVSISCGLDRIAGAGKPLAVSVMGCPSRAAAGNEIEPEKGFAPGSFRSAGWTPETQAQWAAAVGAVIAGKTYVQSLCWQEIADAPMSASAEMPGGGILGANGEAKPAVRALGEIRKALREKKGLPGTTGW
ncbi:hypothetical protein BH11PLA1_BH11PLA1_01060 [soil metagenome]